MSASSVSTDSLVLVLAASREAYKVQFENGC